MELLNEIQAYKSDSTQYTRVLGEALKQIVIMLSPFVPHFCEELWESIGKRAMFLTRNGRYTMKNILQRTMW